MPDAESVESTTAWAFTAATRERHHCYLLPSIFDSLISIRCGSRVLDLGCGSGYVAGQVAAAGFAVTGVDVSESGVRSGREALPGVRFELASVTDPLLPSLLEGPYDAIIAVEVIEHLYSPARFLKNCHTLLKPGGPLILTTPYHGYLKYLVLSVLGKMDGHLQPGLEGGHIKFWSRRSLSEFLVRHGFRPERFRGRGRFPCLWKSMIFTGTRCED